MKRIDFRDFRKAVWLIAALGLALPGAMAAQTAQAQDTAYFAGGCFWCMEPPFDEMNGVVSTVSGYMGGELESPSYEQVSSGQTDHREAVRIVYDPSIVTYPQLLERFWVNVDPFDADGQFCDRGTQYATGIFADGSEQRRAAEASLGSAMDYLSGEGDGGREVATEVYEATAFWPAEEYHQDYYEKNPVRYKFYRFTCGRDGRLEDVWGDAARDGTPLGLPASTQSEGSGND